MSRALEQMDKNVRESFYAARNDIIRLSNQFMALVERVKALEEKQRVADMPRTVRGDQVPARRFVATEGLREFHRDDCLLVKSANPERVSVFYSRLEAEEQGFEPCVCIAQ